jgi:3-methyladenine DNA glycosylase/8-oxoguanine DNA glycosylase
MHKTVLSIHTPAHFNFWRTAYSHGWADLDPFTYNPHEESITRVIALNDTALAKATITGKKGDVTITVTSPKQLTLTQRTITRQQIRTCLRLDEDYSEFHRMAKKHSAFKWIASSGAGRMLRSPTVFEDVVKMICTTNCSWAFTKLMVTNLCRSFGNKFDEHSYAFPTPSQLAASSDAYLRKEIKTGYRSPYLLELAERVSSRRLDLESWRTSTLSVDKLFDQMREVKGIGPYAAGNLMKLVGHYDYLGLDSWVRAQYCRLHHGGRPVKDATIEKHYAQYGKWRGLFFWFEMTRYWHDEKF